MTGHEVDKINKPVILKAMEFPKFSDSQISKLSDIAANIGLVALASVVLPAILDRFELVTVIVGLIITFITWGFSLWLLKKR